MTIHDYQLKAGVLHALVAAGAEVTITPTHIDTVNGRRPRWEIRFERRMGVYSVSHINIGRGQINRGMRIVRPKDGAFDFAAIAHALIEDVDKQGRDEQRRQENNRQEAALAAKEGANEQAVVRIVAEHGGQPTAYRTPHCKLSARSYGIVIETTTENENEARAVTTAIEHTLRGLREKAAS